MDDLCLFLLRPASVYMDSLPSTPPACLYTAGLHHRLPLRLQPAFVIFILSGSSSSLSISCSIFLFICDWIFFSLKINLLFLSSKYAVEACDLRLNCWPSILFQPCDSYIYVLLTQSYPSHVCFIFVLTDSYFFSSAKVCYAALALSGGGGGGGFCKN